MLKMLECSVRILTFDWLVNSRLQREVWGGKKKPLCSLYFCQSCDSRKFSDLTYVQTQLRK